MRRSFVTSCVAISMVLLASCESKKAHENVRPPADSANRAAPIDLAAKGEKPEATQPAPAPAKTDVPTAPPAMVKLEDPEEDAAARGEAVSFAEAFPQRLRPTEKLSDKMAKRIRYALRAVTKAPIALRHFIQVPNPDGSLDVFAIYEYAGLESCIRGHATRKEGSIACRRQADETDCVKLGAVRAHFGVPKEGTSMETSGALSVGSTQFEGVNCAADQELVFVDDVDRDGKLEMMIDLTTTDVSGVENRAAAYWEYRRELVVFTGERGRDPFQLYVDSWDTSEPSDVPPSPLASEIKMGDFNRDGHLDFLHSESPDCTLEDERHNRLYDAERDAKIAWCEKQPRVESVFLYDLQADQWAEPKKAEAGAAKAK